MVARRALERQLSARHRRGNDERPGLDPVGDDVMVGASVAAALLCLVNSTGYAAPTINSPAVTPTSIPVSTATAVTFTASITDPTVTTTGINLQRLHANGNTFTTVGTMFDDGTHGDATAGDQTFSLQLTLTEPSPFPITFRISAPVKGSLTRIFSNLIVRRGASKLADVAERARANHRERLFPVSPPCRVSGGNGE